MSSFESLEAWKKGMELAKAVHVATRSWPSDEKFGLTSQIRRAGISIPSNTAEGYGRGSDPEFARFLSIAYGSCMEVEPQLMLAMDFGYLDAAKGKTMLELCRRTERIIKGLRKSLGK